MKCTLQTYLNKRNKQENREVTHVYDEKKQEEDAQSRNDACDDRALLFLLC